MNCFPSATSSIRKEKQSTRLTFFFAGYGLAVWAPLVPYAKERAGLSEGTLGILLLCLGAGSLLAMPIAGAITARKGCRKVIIASTMLVCLSLPLLTVFSSLLPLAITLFCFGAGIGSLDSTVNTQAVIVERNSGKTLMSGFHGLFSLGGIVGAAGTSALLSLSCSPLQTTLIAVAIMLVTLYFAAPNLLQAGAVSTGPLFAVPHGLVVLIGCICFVAFLAEGAMLDWSAVLLIELKGIASQHAGVGYVLFACTMTFGRLTGDRLIRRFRPQQVVLVGGLSSALGFALIMLAPNWELSLFGFALVGIGCANIAPVMFSLIGKQKVMPESLAVPAISTMGYAGILAGPAFIGFIAHATNLQFSFVLVALMLAVAALGARRLFRS
ncbi:MFS transporter [Pseudomonas sp. TCU-HL1]|uniref:MFS transporter n=1 Tax=Pseudomonas sp. TCU-HL1 TaxID=1856685 RepID=UPI00083DC68A|nr:MFS transporter [Pseudomonas sp. TCU-HL1]AOE85900.1 MFS transporter [Pseudomonas sp. TCU-HL1]